MGTPLVIGHRGASGAAPENTMAAFRRAVRDGADGIELDVRLTADERLIVHHDSRLGRTSTGKGAVRKFAIADLARFDAGSWFDRKYARERLPRLEEVLDRLPRSLMVNIEVKTDGDIRRRNVTVRVLAGVLAAHRGSRSVLVTSFDHTFLRRFHEYARDVPTGALFMPVRDAAKSPSRLQRTLGVSTFVCSCSQLRRRLVANVRKHHMHLAVYGVTSRKHLDKAKRFGVDAVITDHPSFIIHALRHS